MKKRIFGIVLASLLLCSFALVGCDKDDNKDPSPSDGIGTTAWADMFGVFLTENNLTAEAQMFASHYSDFKLVNGKYVAEEIDSVNGFVCKNVEITLDADGKIDKITYEHRTASKDTPDRHVSIDVNGVTITDIPKPSDNTQMNEDEWKEQAEVFADVTNYTLSRADVSSGEPIAAMKLNNGTYFETWNGNDRIWTIESSKYYTYTKWSDSTAWVKEAVAASSYMSAIGTPTMMVTVAANAIQENFSSFHFNAGIYTTEEITINDLPDFTLRDVEITVSGGRIVRAIVTLVGGYGTNDGDERITVDHIGSTDISLPQTFTDNSKPVAGKVDEATWAKTLQGLSNLTIHSTITTEDETIHVTTMIDGNLVEQTQEGKDAVHFISEKNEEDEYTQYVYNETDGTWIKLRDPQSGMIMAAEMPLNFVKAIGGSFEEFTFANGAYTCGKLSVGVEMIPVSVLLTNVKIVFNGTALSEISFTAGMDGTDMGTYTADTFGTTKVTVPDKYEEGTLNPSVPTVEYEVDETTWKTALSLTPNVTIHSLLSNSVEENPTEVMTKLDGDKIEHIQADGTNDSHLIGVKGSNTFTTYELNEKTDSWVMNTEQDEGFAFTYKNNRTSLSVFSEYFNEFDFEDGKYVCAKLVISMQGGSTIFNEVEIVFVDGKLAAVSYTAVFTFGNPDEGGFTSSGEYTYTDFGSTTVDLPNLNN